MASLVKPWLVTYRDRKGRRCRKGDPGAKPRRTRARKWYAQGVPGWPVAKRQPLSADKERAGRMLNELVRRAELGMVGLPDGAAMGPLAGHLADFRATLDAKGKTAKHARQTHEHCRAILDGCGFKAAEDLDPLKLAQWLAAERAADRIGAKTSNYYLRDFKAFLRWLSRGRGLARDHPCLDVEPVDAGQDVRRARRDLPPADLLAVLGAAAASSKRFKGLDGPGRYFLYLTACGTGFRVQELASLTPAAFALDARPPTATVAARRSKNRRVSTQPLPDGVVTELRGFLAGKPTGEKLWPGSWWRKAAEMLQIDLAAAGVPYTVPGLDGVDRYADFHALRHTYITYLADAGVSPKHAQELARHSDIRLTLDRYTHARADELAESVNRLALPAGGSGATLDPLAGMSRADLETAVRILTELVGWFVCTMFAQPTGSAETLGRERSGTEPPDSAGVDSPQV